MKKGFQFGTNIYSVVASFSSILFGVVMESGLFIFLGFALLAVLYFSLRKAINKDRIVRIERGNQVDIYVNDTLIESKTI